MSELTITNTPGGVWKPLEDGIYPAVCVDVIDLGILSVDTPDGPKMQRKIKLVFETEELKQDGTPYFVSRRVTASLNEKSTLAKILGTWRGRPIAPGEAIDLGNLIGKCATIMVACKPNTLGKVYAQIEAVSKPTKIVTPSGKYDPAAEREREATRNAAREAQGKTPFRQAAVATLAPVAPVRKSAGELPADIAPKAPDKDWPKNAPVDPEVGF